MNSEAHFWSLAVPHGSGCWLWAGERMRGGYGRYGINGVRERAHRIAYRLSTGVDPLESCVCHKCDTPLCVNPDHLFLGTRKDNFEDMRAKGRNVNPPLKRGEDHYEGRLKNDDVRRIRLLLRAGFTGDFIAKLHGVSHGLISHIKNGRKWAHVL